MQSPLETELVARLRHAELAPDSPHAIRSEAPGEPDAALHAVRVAVGRWLIGVGTWLAGPPPLPNPLPGSTWRVIARHR